MVITGHHSNFFIQKFENCLLKIMNEKERKQIIKKKHIHPLIIIDFGTSLTLAKESIWH